MKTPYIIGGLALIVVATIFILFVQQGISRTQPAAEKGVVTSSDIDFGEDALKPAEVMEEGITYQDPAGKFEVTYPADYTFDDSDPSYPRLYKREEQARSQSELSDGVLIVFEKIALNGQTLEQLVDDRLQQASTDGSSEVVQPKEETSIGTSTGFEYELRGLGTAQYVYLQASADSDWALGITYTITDPETRGYEVEVNSILSTLELRE